MGVDGRKYNSNFVILSILSSSFVRISYDLSLTIYLYSSKDKFFFEFCLQEIRMNEKD